MQVQPQRFDFLLEITSGKWISSRILPLALYLLYFTLQIIQIKPSISVLTSSSHLVFSGDATSPQLEKPADLFKFA